MSGVRNELPKIGTAEGKRPIFGSGLKVGRASKAEKLLETALRRCLALATDLQSSSDEQLYAGQT
jgi:hypothetical protein